MPFKAMLCGELLALSVMVTAAVNAPVARGANSPWIVQLAPTARVVPQVLVDLNEDAFAAVTAMLLIAKGLVPVLVRVTDCEVLAAPTATEPNDRLVADNDACGISTPVPLSGIICVVPATFKLSSVITALPSIVPPA